MMDVTDPYCVRRGDTLGAIAKRAGKSVQDLMHWNGIKNQNLLTEGQSLYLSEEKAFGVSVLFLDALRNPIENLLYKIQYDGQTKSGTTSANGFLPQMVTHDAKSRVEVWIQDLQGHWQNVCNQTSDFGHKLITLVSSSVVIKGETEKHPPTAPVRPEASPASKSAPGKAGKQPPPPPAASGTPSKNNPAVKTKTTKGKQGQSIVQISVDIPEGLTGLFDNYVGGEITQEQWEEAAERIDCETEVLRAIAEVESGGRIAFWRLNKADGANIPAILYERHYFSKATQNKYDKDHPDISWPTGYRKKDQLGKKDTKMSDGQVDADDIYSDYASAYLRLINAYRLDPNAALKSCSWGKFQIMGDNHVLCGEKELANFVKKMCTSEAAQIGLLAEFIRNKPRSWKNPKNKVLGKEISLWDAVKTKDWAAIAFNYNGPGYKTYGYDTKLKNAYEKHKQST
ncbi:MAG: hypothetical protein CVU18_17990 [Betaproteobacteria bacterium HGW-Betaproteobacteria-12]|nr:MAG: hypothetical protein CVU18_17990 [Betaproteobacteria bacterium HGW-Betaproteobacteria-12]